MRSANVAEANPEVVARLQALADAAWADLGDTLRDIKGTGRRPPGRLVETATRADQSDGKR